MEKETDGANVPEDRANQAQEAPTKASGTIPLRDATPRTAGDPAAKGSGTIPLRDAAKPAPGDVTKATPGDAAPKASGTIPLRDGAPRAREAALTEGAKGPAPETPDSPAPKASTTIPLHDPTARPSTTIPITEDAPDVAEPPLAESPVGVESRAGAETPAGAESIALEEIGVGPDGAPLDPTADDLPPVKQDVSSDGAHRSTSARPADSLASNRPPPEPVLSPSPDKAPPAEPPPASRALDAGVRPQTSGRRTKKVLLWSLGVFLVLLATGAAVVLIFGPDYARGRILEEAQARGVTLAFGEMELGSSRIRLHDVRVALSGVRDFEAAAAWVDVDIADGQPVRVAAGDLSIAMTGTEVLTAIGEWKNAHPGALSAPLSGEGAHVEWHPQAGAAIALSLDSAKVAVDAQKGSIDAGTARFLGRDAGPVEVAWSAPPEGFLVEITPRSAPLSALHLQVRSTKEGPRLKGTLARTPLGPLQSALGIPKGSEGLMVDGEVEMPVPSLAKPAPVTGTLRLAVKGYTPPHPRELDGILFGDTTTVKSRFELAADLESAKLEDVTAEAGALSLSGGGDLTRDGLDARVRMKLKGSIPCSSLATSAAVARLGSGLGRLAGGLAAGALTGSVGVTISVDAKASDVKGAKITQSARIGCKVTIPGVGSLVIK